MADELHNGREAALAQSCPDVHATLTAWRASSLSDYAAHLFAAPVAPLLGPAVLRSSRAILAAELEPWARGQLAAASADLLLTDVTERPVVQTGDHAELLVSPLNFATNCVTALGAREAGKPAFVVNASSTVTLLSRGTIGPGLLKVAGTRINLFGLPRRALAGTSMCALGAVELAWRQSGVPLPTAEARVATALHDLTAGEVFPSAGDAIVTFNARLWKRVTHLLSHEELPTPVFTDDRLTSAVVAAHLEQGAPLSRLLFDPETRGRFLSLRAAAAGLIPHATDFLWGVRDGRIRPLRLSHDSRLGLRLCEQPKAATTHGQLLTVPFEPGTVARLLRTGGLVPDLVTGFAAMSVLPAARALGGARQSVYLPALATAVADALGAGDSRAARSLYGWVTGVWELSSHPVSILARACAADPPGPALLDTLSSRPLGATVGTLAIMDFLRRSAPPPNVPTAASVRAWPENSITSDPC